MAFSNDNISQVFAHYIENFSFINNDAHEEYYKWQVCYEFPMLMDQALAAPHEEFASALLKARNCTRNIIDSYTQPFMGLVKFAEEEDATETVRELLKNLYAPDGGDLNVQMQKIEAFFDGCNALLEKYYPGSFLYKQNSHSVSALLFLYDPDHHYMYKATECKTMADCIGFYDSWGSGDNIKLDVFYRMCDRMIKRIFECPELLETDAGRFDERFQKLREIPLHPDQEKHLLLFDMIYCCHTYHLFDIIPFAKPDTKERKLYLENQKKAERLKKDYDAAKEKNDRLQDALLYFTGAVNVGDTIHHKKYGACQVVGINEKYIFLNVPSEERIRQLGLSVVIANGIVWYDTEDFKEKQLTYKEILKKSEEIPKALDYAAKALEPFKEYVSLE